jgi:hypothetical protein
MPTSFEDARYALQDSLERIADSLRTAARAFSGDVGDAVARAAQEAADAAETVRDYAAEMATDVRRRTAHQIEDHPIASVALAVTVAAALAALLIAATHRR